MPTTISGRQVWRDGFGFGCPESLYCLRDASVLERRRLGLICSVKCPGSIILRTHDLMRDLRNEDLTVISGFHSPMERECLNILLRGKCGVVICCARSLPVRVPAEFRKPMEEGRLLVLSAFPDGQNHITKASSAARNRQVAEISDVLFVPYASPGDMVEGICRDVAQSTRAVFTFDGDFGASLQALGAQPIPLSGVAVFLQGIS